MPNGAQFAQALIEHELNWIPSPKVHGYKNDFQGALPPSWNTIHFISLVAYGIAAGTDQLFL